MIDFDDGGVQEGRAAGALSRPMACIDRARERPPPALPFRPCALIEGTRSQMARILRRLGPEALGRVGVHNERGPRTLEELLTGANNHIPHHVRFIIDKRRALGLPA